jgi:hypothetical protein
MRQRTVEIDCDAATARALSTAVSAYAHAAFPDGGSECAQVSREALLDTARACAGHGGGPLALRKRQLPQLRTAVAWYYDESGEDGRAANDIVGARLKRLLAKR